MSSGCKNVRSVDEYSHLGKDYVEVETVDGWFYVFVRLRSDEPYSIHKKRRDDGSAPMHRGRHTPWQVVEYMEEHYDVADVHMDQRGHL